ncbi:hypothetical protein FRUB_09425 [Fimbriiglobus ruber]|uniref:Prepilin type IV endopeptidase peptidase domain-containing protein n=1 Tax=Fimbriiglobus ruber TaxID=1908690 RepID=A0A225D6J2_9BACT|nr:hypothetical protein FRUB_09425 [Fimbriiglobus ruber]
MPVMALGLVMNAVRGGWLGAEGRPLWAFETGSVWLGTIDGLAWSVVGFAVAFAVMCLFWIFGTCGGGDVKLIAAVAAWVGLPYIVLIWIVSSVVLIVWTLVLVVAGVPSVPPVPQPGQPRPQTRRRTTYALPVAVATIAVLLFVFWTPLGFPPVKAGPPPS